MAGAAKLENFPTAEPQQTPSAHSKLAWPQYIWLIVLLPFIQALLSWDFDGNLSSLQYVMRHLSVPALTVEIFILFYAMGSGFSPLHAINRLETRVRALILVWFVFAIASSLLQYNDKLASLLTMSRFILHGCFLAAVVYCIANMRTPESSRWLNTISIGIVCYVAVLAIFALIVSEPDKFPWATRMPSATNIRQIANIVAISAAAPIALLLFGNGAYQRSSAFSLAALVMFLAWSGSRTALFAIVVSIFAAMIFVRTWPKFKAATVMMVSFVFGLVASLPLPAPSPAFGLIRMFDKMQETDNVSSGRMQFWIDTIGEISKHPWLGYGSGRFRENMHQMYGTNLNHPHNFILQFTYDWGIFGAAAILSLLLCLMWTIWKKAPTDPLIGFATGSGFLTLCAIAMVDGAFFYPLTIIAAIMMIAPILVSTDKCRGLAKL